MDRNFLSDGRPTRGRRPLLRLPAVQALLMQCLSLIVVLSLMAALSSYAGVNTTVTTAVLGQGACAAALSRFFRLASWWVLMQFVFPIALSAALMLHLPSIVYLLAFLFFLALYWTTFRSQTPFYPSGPAIWRGVRNLLPQYRPVRFVDIGSGFGGLIRYLARQRMESEFIGVEVAPLPWFVSRMRAALSPGAATFLRADYDRLDLGSFDVVFAYLSPAAMPALWCKARAEMRPGSLLLSYEFPIPGVESQITNISTHNGPILYGWNM